MSRRALARAGAIGVATALAVAVSTVPGGTQTESAPAGTTVVAVSGHASGAFFEIAFDDSIVMDPTADVGAIRDALSSDDSAALEALFEPGVGTAALEPFVQSGPTPIVTLPAEGGGPFTASAAQFAVEGLDEDALVLAGALNVSTQGALGPSGFARSNASVADVGTEAGEGLPFTAELVEVECSSDLGGMSGATSIVGGDVTDPGLGGEIPANPAPNTLVFEESQEDDIPEGHVEFTITLVANEQVVGANDITVRGLHLHAAISLTPPDEPTVVAETEDFIIGETACGVVPGAEILPTFTG